MKLMLYNLDFNNEFDFDDYLFLEIQNLKYFSKIVAEIKGIEQEIKDFSLLDKDKLLEIDKDYFTLIDYFNFDIYSKPVIGKIYKSIEKHYQGELSVSQKLNGINNKVIDFVKSLLIDYDVEFSFGDEITLDDLLKLVSLKPTVYNNSIYQNIINFILTVSQINLYKLLIFINAQAFFLKEEIEEIIKISAYYKVKILFVDSCFYENSYKKIQIDEDYFVKIL